MIAKIGIIMIFGKRNHLKISGFINTLLLKFSWKIELLMLSENEIEYTESNKVV